MKRNWSLVMVILFMLCAGAAERLSAYYVEHLRDESKNLEQRTADMKIRTDAAAAETKKYQEIEHLAALIQDHIRWESDSTRLMRSFGDIAARMGVKLVETRTSQADQANLIVGGGAYQRIPIDVRLQGSFWNLLQYVDAVECSAQPMVIESLVMTADRDKAGTGELRLTVSALYPVAQPAGPTATAGGAK